MDTLRRFLNQPLMEKLKQLRGSIAIGKEMLMIATTLDPD
jgi:hypothetical protein